MAEPAELNQRLAASRQRLLRAIAGVTEEQFKRRPPASEAREQPWCIAEVLAHLLFMERERSDWIEQALTADQAPVKATPAADLDAETRARRMAPVPQLIHGLLAARRELERRLERALRSDQLQRAVVVSSGGRRDVESLIGECIDLEQEHVGRIEALRLVVGARAVEQA